MKRSKFNEAQIAFILQHARQSVTGPIFTGPPLTTGTLLQYGFQAETGTPIGDVCRKAGIAEATFYNWRKKYAGLMPSEMKRLKQLEEENGKLKQLVADLSLDKAMLQDVLKRKL